MMKTAVQEVTPEALAMAKTFVNTMELENLHVDIHETAGAFMALQSDPKHLQKVEAIKKQFQPHLTTRA